MHIGVVSLNEKLRSFKWKEHFEAGWKTGTAAGIDGHLYTGSVELNERMSIVPEFERESNERFTEH